MESPAVHRLRTVVNDFAFAFKAVDAAGPQGKSKSRTYRPGIGPLAEAEAISKAIEFLKQTTQPSPYELAAPQKYPTKKSICDLVIPGEWAIEFKLIRPFGDNGDHAEHWSENILHPYPGNTSSLGDCLKLIDSGFTEQKAIIVFGFEHSPPLVDLNTAVDAFERIAKQVLKINLGERHTAEFGPLIHPVHQQGKIFGWEIH